MTAADMPVRNLKVTQSAEITPDGSTVHKIHTTAMLGEHGPFTVTRPSAQFDAQEVNSALDHIRTQISGIK
jgi:hypothetical protein